MRGLCRLLAAVSTLALCACWNGKDQYRKYQDEGHARNAPLIVYDFTANDPTRFVAEPLALAFVNTEAVRIDSIDLELAVCDTMGQTKRSVSLKLSGPFDPEASFIVTPMGPAEADGHQDHVVIPHAVITSVTVEDSAGSHSFEDKQVAALLDAKIANYCIRRAM